MRIKRERWWAVVEERRSWRWPEKVEKIQSDSRPGGTHMAAILAADEDGESRTETRRWWLERGLGNVKVM